MLRDCPTVTRATCDFLRRCGWLTCEATPLEEGSEVANGRPQSLEGTNQPNHCKLVIGSLQLNIALQVEENADFLDDIMLSKWHIHIGRKDFEALQCNAWDSDICYLAVDPDLGETHSPKSAMKTGNSCDPFAI